MKIATIETFDLTCPLGRPFGWSQGRIEQRNTTLVKITTDDGLTGWGEGAASDLINNLLAPLIIGQDPIDRNGLWERMFHALYNGNNAVGLAGSAVSALDIALWDLAGKALGVPTYRLLGGQAREKVLVYRHVGGATPQDLAERSQALCAEGYKVMRISPITEKNQGTFDPTWAIRNGVAHIEALRRSDDDVEIIFEVHTRLTPARAIEFCNAIEAYRPFFVENPIRSENPAAFATLRAHTNVALGTGEQLHTKVLKFHR